MNADRRNSNFLAAMLGALAVAIPFAGLAVAGVFDADSDAQPASTTTAAADPTPSAVAPATSATDVSALYERVSTGVVSIETRSGSGGGTGSGFVIDTVGHIVTNEHVIDGAETVRVRFSEGAPVSARIVGEDPSNDLALLKVDAGDRKLTPLTLGSSKALKVGQSAIAIGSPFRLEGTLTTGVVSAIGRSISGQGNFSIDNVVQTDAAINPGNSGGPLLDASGRVIGVNAQIASTTGANDGVGFAIPVDTVKKVLPELKAGREVKPPYLGVSTGDATTGTGAQVAAVVDGGPAERAGLRVGDRIVAISGREVTRSTDVSAIVTERKPGDRIDIRVRRGRDERTISVTLGTRPSGSS
ncbi:MAG TPA: trypsin-like peptidase domain-containing protein [Solirubrobacteraceae bacterium]|nr:trypsin-like peptidase domain-containing protein [Solirubrobacteraceae bacterium]